MGSSFHVEKKDVTRIFAPWIIGSDASCVTNANANAMVYLIRNRMMSTDPPLLDGQRDGQSGMDSTLESHRFFGWESPPEKKPAVAFLRLKNSERFFDASSFLGITMGI